MVTGYGSMRSMANSLSEKTERKGERMHQCQCCGSKWESDHKTEKCPFCGAVLEENKEKLATVDDALKYICKIYGDEIFRERNKLIGLLADFVPKLERERRLIKIAIECGAYQAIYESPKQDRDHVMETYLSMLSENYFLNEEMARQALLWCANALEKTVPTLDAEKNNILHEIDEPKNQTNTNANGQFDKIITDREVNKREPVMDEKKVILSLKYDYQLIILFLIFTYQESIKDNL